MLGCTASPSHGGSNNGWSINIPIILPLVSFYPVRANKASLSFIISTIWRLSLPKCYQIFIRGLVCSLLQTVVVQLPGVRSHCTNVTHGAAEKEHACSAKPLPGSRERGRKKHSIKQQQLGHVSALHTWIDFDYQGQKHHMLRPSKYTRCG